MTAGETSNQSKLGASEPEPETTDERENLGPALRHIAIGGVSFVGSTVLGVLLGSLDGFANIGESHWLTERQHPRSGQIIATDFAAAVPDYQYYCRVCKAACPVLTREFRAGLAADPAGWYNRIANHLETKVLVSSDKSLNQYRRLAPASNFDLIVLYRPPTSFIRSNKKAMVYRASQGFALPAGWLEIGPVLRHWVNNYNRLREMQPSGSRIVMNWENFVAKPNEYFDRLLALLNLPGSSDVFEHIRPGHFIGGNNVGGLLTSKRFRARPSVNPPLSDEEAEAILRDEPSQTVFQRLEAEHREYFNGL
ncbi:MAG TPA: hypothetical protein VFQ82_13820 [Stellaceae bacterium]|jgi:hypothetical protein|nr:hypothetical protein [Stellaceae bacterium]